MTTVAPFRVHHELVARLEALIQELAQRSRMTTLTVPAEEFPAWLVVLGKEDFHATVGKNGNQWIRSGYALLGEDPATAPMMSVSCDTPPAPWVAFPSAEGDRRYMFRYELDRNPLIDNETESE